MNTKDVLVGLPTFNEEHSVSIVLSEIKKLGLCPVISDGGSTDSTITKAHELDVIVLARPGKGKGAGMNQIIEYAVQNQYRYVAFLDCDQTYPTVALRELISRAEYCDMVVGVRDYSKIAWPNRLANRFFNFVINLLYGSNLRDTQSGMRILKLSSLGPPFKAQDFSIEAEITCKALAAKLNIEEVDIDYYPRIGNSKIKYTDAFFIILQTLKVRIDGCFSTTASK